MKPHAMKQRTTRPAPRNKRSRPPRVPLTIIYVPGLFDRVGWAQFLQRKAIDTALLSFAPLITKFCKIHAAAHTADEYAQGQQ